jgi:ABC-type branched-subunit amino acid transport system ATPase component
MANGEVIAKGVEEEIMNNKDVIEVYLGDTYRET